MHRIWFGIVALLVLASWGLSVVGIFTDPCKCSDAVNTLAFISFFTTAVSPIILGLAYERYEVALDLEAS